MTRSYLGVQLGVTLASLALGWLGEPTIEGLIEPLFGRVPHAAVYAHAIAATVAFASITYLHVIFGEIVPKSLALHRGERVALAVAAPMDVFLTLARPFMYIMSKGAGTWCCGSLAHGNRPKAVCTRRRN